MEDGIEYDTNGGCWLWTRSTHSFGYGIVNLPKRSGQRLAHNVAWETRHGAIPPGMCVCHRCDVPQCVNPAHLFLGTQQDNMRDMVAKRRHCFGESKVNAKLCDADIPAIRARLSSGEAPRQIGADFGVSRGAIVQVQKRRTWTHV